MQARNRTTNLLKKSLMYAVLSVIALAMSIPFLWMISTSLKAPPQIFVFPPEWIPNPLLLQNYPKGLTVLPFVIFFKNTAIITGACMVGVLLSCSITAYAFARIKFPGRELLFFVVLAMLMIPEIIRLLPLFVFFQKLGWVNTFYPLTVPTFFASSSFSIFLLRQFFLTIPREYSDAARIDGCSHFTIYYKIILPMSKPALAVVAIFVFQWKWNDFLWPLVLLNDTKMKTLTLGLQMMAAETVLETNWGHLMAASTAVIVPILVLFFFTQKYFLRGISLGTLK